MKIMITGGNRGLGLILCRHFAADSFSRQNGFDITKAHDRATLADLSLTYDVFVNNAFDGPFQESWADFGQTKLLHQVAALWQQHDRSGWIINVGSVGTETVVAPDPAWETYRVSKAALKAASRQWTRAFKDDRVRFKTSLLTLDRLDTPLTRSRDNWTDNGLHCQDVATYMEMILSAQPNTCIEEIVAWVNFNHKQT